MKKTALLFLLGAAILLSGSGTAMAVSTDDEKKLEQEIEDLNHRGTDAQGNQQVVRKLEQEFSVSESQVTNLRGRNLGFGEIAVVFSLAGKMPGGITDDNVNRIMTMRQGPPAMGWGRIARELGTKLGPVVSEVKHVSRESRGEMKNGHSSSRSESREKHEVKGKDKEQQRELRRDMMRHEGIGRGMERDQGRGR